MCVFLLSMVFLFKQDHIRLTLSLMCEPVGPSVTLQMALLVKVGHGRFLSSAEDRTMEITGV